MRKTLERKKYCPVCHDVAAVLDGDPEKYGDRAMGWNRFIATKYCCDECREIMNGQAHRKAVRSFRKRRREQREVAFDAIDALRAEVKVSKERESLLERENRLSRQRIAELEARQLC